VISGLQQSWNPWLFALHGHSDWVRSVAFSPDGRTIACGGFFGLAEGDQKPLYLFDRTTGKLSIPINDLLSWPVKLAFTHDGQYLVMALGIRQGLRIYRTTDWKMVLNDGDYGGLLQGLAVDRSSRIATVSEDGFIRLYEHFRLTKKEPLEGGKLPRNVSFSPSGQFLAVLFKDSSNVSVLSGSDLKPLYQATTPSGNLRFGSVAWSSDGQALFAAGEYVSDGKHQGAIRMWDQAGKGDATTVSVSDHPIADLVLLPDGRHAYSTESGEVGLVAPSTGKRTVLAQSANIEYSEAPRVSKDATVVQFGPGPHDAFDTKTRSFGSTTAVIPPITDAEKIKVTNWLNQKGTRINGKLLPISGSDFARSVAIAPSRDKVILGTTFQLLCFDPTGQVCWAHDVIGPARVNVASNQETVVASLGDGTIRWYRMTDGAELLVLFVHSDRKRWIMWTPSGYFDAAEGAEDLIGWHVNQGKDKAALFYPASHFFEQFYRPDLVAEVLKSVETDQQVLARLGEKERVTLQAGLKRPPTVTIVSPKPNAQFDLDEVEIQVQATDEGGGIDEIRLYHNGKVVGDQARGIKTMPSSVSASNSKVFRVLLVEGQNTVRAVAFSRDRIEGDPAEIQIRFKGLSTKATLHVLLVGINEYKNRALNLNYAVPDAKGMRDYFNGPRSGLFKEVKWHALYDKEATKPEILIKLQALQTSAPQDVVVIYLAGHGESIANTWYFVPHEVTTPEREDRLTQQGISSVELKALIERIGAQKVLVLLDACKSGAVMTAFGARGLEDRKALAQLARSTGVHVVAASTKDQFATEVTQLGHGVFTYTLLEGLNGKADGSPTDKSITVRELLSYVERQLPEVSEKYKTQAQYPVVDSRGMDFPIATMR
jgi:WD40 repeat protein